MKSLLNWNAACTFAVKIKNMSSPKVGEAAQIPVSETRHASKKPQGLIAVRFGRTITEKTIKFLTNHLFKNTSVCKNASELDKQTVGDLMLINPTTWDEWDTVYRGLSEKTEQGRKVYLLDNSIHAGDCADWEMVLDRDGRVLVEARCLWGG